MVKNCNVEGFYYLFWYMYQIKLYFLEGIFSDGIVLVELLMKFIKDNIYNWDDWCILVFYYCIVCFYFVSGDNSKVIDYFNLIFNQKNFDYWEDIQSFV